MPQYRSFEIIKNSLNHFNAGIALIFRKISSNYNKKSNFISSLKH